MDGKSINTSAFSLPGSSERFVVVSETDFEALQTALEEARMEAQAKYDEAAKINESIPVEITNANLNSG